METVTVRVSECTRVQVQGLVTVTSSPAAEAWAPVRACVPVRRRPAVASL